MEPGLQSENEVNMEELQVYNGFATACTAMCGSATWHACACILQVFSVRFAFTYKHLPRLNMQKPAYFFFFNCMNENDKLFTAVHMCSCMCIRAKSGNQCNSR